MADKKDLRCHVIAGVGSSLAPLLKVLNELNYSVVRAESLSPAGEMNPADLSSQLKQADVVVAVMQGEHDNVVMLEIGVALGLAKPIFLIFVGTEVPFVLESLPSLKVPNLSDSSLYFHLQQLRERLLVGSSRVVRLGKNRTSSTPAFPGWVSARHLPTLSERGLEQLVAEALGAAGVVSAISTALANPSSTDAPDIVVWFKDLPETLSNPVVVEVRKRMLPSEPRVVEKLHKYARAAGTKTALLIVDDPSFDKVKVAQGGGGYVFIMSTTVLFREITRGSLFDALIHARNIAAHAEGP